MSFDQLSGLIQSGQVDQYKLVPSANSLIGPENVRIKIKTMKGQKLEAIVRIDPKENIIYPPYPILVRDEYPNPKKLAYHIDPESFDDWPVGKFITRVRPNINENEKEEALKIPGYQWSSGKTLNDLLALNLAFIQGIIPQTPYHFGPLDPESNIIIDELNLLNRLDIITVNSQPYDVFPDFQDNERTIYQYPYLYFYYPREKSKLLNQLIKEFVDTALVYHYHLETGKEDLIVEPNPELVTNGEYQSALYVKGDQVTVEPIPGSLLDMVNHFGVMLGDNFQPLVEHELDHYVVYDLHPSNKIFSILAGLAKALI